MTTTVTIDQENERFVLTKTNGVSCLGFDVALNRIKQYAMLLKKQVAATLRGTLEQYHQYMSLEQELAHQNLKQVIYDPDTPFEVEQVLERARTLHFRVRLVFGNTETGDPWLDTTDVVGRVGNTCGPLRAPILVEPGDVGGGIILSAHVLRIVHAASGRVLYEHPKYKTPTMRVKHSDEVPDYPFEVVLLKSTESEPKEELMARFTDEKKAKRYADFMTGVRHTL
jgi:hypothetical protein